MRKSPWVTVVGAVVNQRCTWRGHRGQVALLQAALTFVRARRGRSVDHRGAHPISAALQQGVAVVSRARRRGMKSNSGHRRRPRRTCAARPARPSPSRASSALHPCELVAEAVLREVLHDEHEVGTALEVGVEHLGRAGRSAVGQVPVVEDLAAVDVERLATARLASLLAGNFTIMLVGPPPDEYRRRPSRGPTSSRRRHRSPSTDPPDRDVVPGGAQRRCQPRRSDRLRAAGAGGRRRLVVWWCAHAVRSFLLV